MAGGDNAAADSVKIGNQRIELMKKYGIIKNDKNVDDVTDMYRI